MNYKKYFILFAVALMAVACQDEKPQDPKSNAKPGDEVQFGGALEDNSVSRTIYDWENATSSAFPILWLADDQVIVASPQAMAGRNTGIYGVPTTAANKNYAGQLVKKSPIGVQW